MGGATHSALTIIEEMAKRANQVIVVSPDMDDSLKERLDSQKIQWRIVHLGFKAYPQL